MEVLAVLVLISVVLLAVVGAPIFLFARRSLRASRKVAVSIAIVVSPLLIGVAVWVFNECSLSNYLRRELSKMLPQEEQLTLRGNHLFCSTSYAFQRRGKPAEAIVVPGLFRDKIFIGDDTGP